MNRSHWLTFTVFIGSVFAILLFWILLPAEFRVNESADYKDHYEPVAESILAGRGIVRFDGAPATRTPPGGPLILAGIFGLSELLHLPRELVLSSSILLITGLSSVLVWFIARSIWGPLAGMLAAGLWTTYPFILWLTKQPSTELPFIAILYAGFWLFWSEVCRQTQRSVIHFLCGLLLGGAMLIRPIAIGVGFVIAAMLWFIRTETLPRVRLTLIAMILLGNFVAVLPWEAWVYFRTGRVVPLSTIGPGSMVDGLTFAIRPRPEPHLVKIPADVRSVMEEILKHEYKNTAGVLVEQVKVRPTAVAKLVLLKAARSWYGTDSERFERVTLLLQIPYIALLLWSSADAWKTGGHARRLVLMIWVIVLYFWGMALLAVSLLRYMVPAVALLFVTTPSLLSRCLRWPRLSSQRLRTTTPGT